uniref:Uncharacterized protein n=1 Tax=Oxyrrhis marina TaxID=2969 RepID=A0A7S3UHM5_OXYMA
MRAIWCLIAAVAAGFSRQLESHDEHTYKGALEVDTKTEVDGATEAAVKGAVGPMIASTLSVAANTLTVDSVTKTGVKYAVGYTVVVTTANEEALKTAIAGQAAKLTELAASLKTALNTEADITITITTALAEDEHAGHDHDDHDHDHDDDDDEADETSSAALQWSAVASIAVLLFNA